VVRHGADERGSSGQPVSAVFRCVHHGQLVARGQTRDCQRETRQQAGGRSVWPWCCLCCGVGLHLPKPERHYVSLPGAALATWRQSGTTPPRPRTVRAGARRGVWCRRRDRRHLPLARRDLPPHRHAAPSPRGVAACRRACCRADGCLRRCADPTDWLVSEETT
jgi:hypothetical protein